MTYSGAGPTIRAPRTDDVDEVLDLWVALAAGQRRYGSHVLADANRDAVREQLLQAIVAEDLLVAVDDGRHVGFISYCVQSGRYQQDQDRGVVRHLYVVEDRRREGIGSALLSAAQGRLADRDVDAVALEAMADNERARAFYRAHGYDAHRVELEANLDGSDDE